MDPVQLAIVLVVSALDIALGVAVLQRNSHSKTHRLFAAAALAMVGWTVANFLCDQPAFFAHALFFNRLTIALGLLLVAPLFAFAVCYPKKRVALSRSWRLLLLPVPLLVILGAATPALVQDVQLESWGTNIIQGPLFPVTVAWGVIACAALAITLVHRYRHASTQERSQHLYLYMGLGLFLGFSMVIGAVLPVLTGSNEFAKLQPIATILFLIPTGYAVIRHRLMDVQFLALRTVSYSALLFTFSAAFVLLVQAAHTEYLARIGLNSDVVIFLTGLAAVLSFQHVRTGFDRLTDRLFYRRTYDPNELLSQLSSKMTSAHDQRGLAEILAEELPRGMRLTFGGVAFLCDGRAVLAATGGLTLTDAEMLVFMSGNALIVTDEVEPDTPGHTDLIARDIRVLAPLSPNDSSLGALILGPKLSGESYSSQDVRFLEIVVAEAAIRMRNAYLIDEKTQRVRELTALNELAFALGSSIDLEAVLDGALKQLVTVTSADSGSIMLADDAGEYLTIAASTSIDSEIVASTRVPIGEGIAGWVARNNRPLSLPHAAHVELLDELLRDDIASAICAPIMSKDRVIGVICVSRTNTSEEFSEENLHVVTSIAGQLGMAIENARLYGDLEDTFMGTITALAAAVDAKDPYTAGHSNEVTTLAVALAQDLGLDAEEVQKIRIAATLHDIGKIGIDGTILLKPGRLTEEERQTINRHPAIGADILAPLDFLREMVPLVLFHHERYGGGGYPSGICGEAIPFGARIISVADAFNAMVSDRPYREGLSLEAAMREIRDNSGTQFDPVVAEAFLKLLERESASVGRVDFPTSLPVATAWRADKPLLAE